jgi:hypothetical protein
MARSSLGLERANQRKRDAVQALLRGITEALK